MNNNGILVLWVAKLRLRGGMSRVQGHKAEKWPLWDWKASSLAPEGPSPGAVSHTCGGPWHSLSPIPLPKDPTAPRGFLATWSALPIPSLGPHFLSWAQHLLLSPPPTSELFGPVGPWREPLGLG